MFFCFHIKKFNSYSISSKLHGLSDYIIIEKEFIQEKKLTIIKNSEEEK